MKPEGNVFKGPGGLLDLVRLSYTYLPRCSEGLSSRSSLGLVTSTSGGSRREGSPATPGDHEHRCSLRNSQR